MTIIAKLKQAEIFSLLQILKMVIVGLYKTVRLIFNGEANKRSTKCLNAKLKIRCSFHRNPI